MGIWKTGDLQNGRATAFELFHDCMSDADRELFKRKGVIKLQR
jgi:hypothetical protein